MQQQGNFDFTAARARGDIGIENARRHVDRTEPGWADRAVAAVRTYGESIYPTGFTMEQARKHIATCGSLPEPAELRAWGAVTRAACRKGFIERTGEYRAAASSNGSPKPEYRARLVVT